MKVITIKACCGLCRYFVRRVWHYDEFRCVKYDKEVTRSSPACFYFTPAGWVEVVKTEEATT